MAKGLPAYKGIKIGFSKPRSPLAILAFLKRIFGQKPYNDVYVKLQEPVSGQFLIFQTATGCLNFMYEEEFKKHNKIISEYEVACNSSKYYQIWSYCIRKMGCDYSLIQHIHNLFSSKGPKVNIFAEILVKALSLASLQQKLRYNKNINAKYLEQVLKQQNIRKAV